MRHPAQKVVTAAIAGVAMLAALLLAGPTAASEEAKSGDSDTKSEYEWSIVDVVSPSEITAQAQEQFGERYVDVSITSDQSGYVVGVLDLTAEEASVARFPADAPVALESRLVPRGSTEALTGVVQAAFANDNMGLVLIGHDYAIGEVLLVAGDGANIEAIVNRVQAITPGEDRETTDGSGVIRLTTTSDVASVTIKSGDSVDDEAADVAPYRAGKYLAVGAGNNNCTTGWYFRKNGINWGSTAGHCGTNGTNVYFAASQRGDVQWNQLYAGNPAPVDVSLFDMGNGGTAYLYRSTTINREVTGKYDNSDFVAGFRTCTRGAFTGDQSCGNLKAGYIDVQIWSDTANKLINNAYCWDMEGTGPQGGDSGAPVYRVRANESVWAAGMHKGRMDTDGDDVLDAACFMGIGAILNHTNTTLQTTN